MNAQVLKSWVYKLLPVVAAFAVGKGWLNQDTADQLPDLVDWIVVGATLLPTLIRSVKTHKDDADGIFRRST